MTTDIQKATNIIKQAEAALKRSLSTGERRDLLMDQTELSSDQIRIIVERLERYRDNLSREIMRKNPVSHDRIEKSGFRHGEYVGYADGIWRITKQPYGWHASHREAKYVGLRARTLGELNEKLRLIAEGKEHVTTATKNPRGFKRARKFTRKASTPKRQRQWKHVYKSARKRGYSKARAIQQASGIVKRNPKRRMPGGLARGHGYIIVAETDAGRRYVYDGVSFFSATSKAMKYPTREAATKRAKELLPRLGKNVKGLRIQSGKPGPI